MWFSVKLQMNCSIPVFAELMTDFNAQFNLRITVMTRPYTSRCLLSHNSLYFVYR